MKIKSEEFAKAIIKRDRVDTEKLICVAQGTSYKDPITGKKYIPFSKTDKNPNNYRIGGFSNTAYSGTIYVYELI